MPGSLLSGPHQKPFHPASSGELHAIDSHRLWPKTLLVLPPIPDIAIHTRWENFAKAFTHTTMGCHPLAFDPARTLAFFGSAAAGWSVITADQRTEWTYAEALAAATTMISAQRQPQA